MLGELLAAVVAATLTPLNGAYLMAFGDSEAVYITSVPWEEPGATNPWVRAMSPALDEALDARGKPRQVCVRSDHDHPGELTVSSDRFRTVVIPHGVGLATRCALVTTYPWSQERPGRVLVQEGTYWGVNGQTDGPVEGWVRNVTVRQAP